MPSMPLGHPSVHTYAESQKYDGDFMTPSKSRVWTTIQYPKHITHKHVPAQIYLCNARKPLILCKKPCHLYSTSPRGPNGKSFSKAGVVHTPPYRRHANSAAAPRPLPADNGAAGKGYHKNNTRSTRWLKICAVPRNYIQCINTTSPSPLGSPRKQATRRTIPVVSLLRALLHYRTKASAV